MSKFFSSISRQPTIFVGHGSPMHGIAKDDNVYVQSWKKMAASMPRPKAIVAVSAHWFIKDTRVTAHVHPPTIHDFGGFPAALYEVQYPAPGDPELARRVSDIVQAATGELVKLETNQWGLDHGTWTVLRHMYPDADIPVVQLSLNAYAPMDEHYRIGQALSQLRDEGILIFGSGNIVHNFDYLDLNGKKPEQWAVDFAAWVKEVSMDESIDRSDAKNYPIVHWEEHKYGKLAQSYADHFLPILYILGAVREGEKVYWETERFDLGSFSMASLIAR